MSYKLLDANNGDADLSLSWVTVTYTWPTNTITYKPRGVMTATLSHKIKFTSVSYSSVTLTSNAWAVVVNS